MKIRNGFVSNSSSSSFILFIPEDFNVENCNLSKFDELEKEVIKKTIETLLIDEYIYDDDLNDNDFDLSLKDELLEILKDYVITSVDVSSDS